MCASPLTPRRIETRVLAEELEEKDVMREIRDETTGILWYHFCSAAEPEETSPFIDLDLIDAAAASCAASHRAAAVERPRASRPRW
jgi:hypothetical protein